jgi:type III restriction enzyme
MIKPADEKKEFEICFPNIIRINHVYKPELKLEMDKVKTLELDAGDNATQADLACVVEGKPDLSELSEIDLRDLGKKYRMQKIIFETAGKIFDQMKPTWKGSREILLAQLIQLVENFISSEKIRISPSFFNDDDLKRRILITLNMTRIVQHI